MEQFQRSAMLLGKEAIPTLAGKKVAVFGLGGVGSYTVEALARTGIGGLFLVDNDRISISNINRQLHATLDTVGDYKTQAMAQRVHAIHPQCQVTTAETFVLPDNLEALMPADVDYIVDAIDTVSGKIALAEYGYHHAIPTISCMGAGNKLDPTQFRVGDLYQTNTCPLCRVMRRELRRRGVPSLKVVYSTEPPCTPDHSLLTPEEQTLLASRPALPGSISFVPSVAGLIAAGEVIKDMLAEDAQQTGKTTAHFEEGR